MNYKMCLRVLGDILICLAGLMLLPMLTGLIYGESIMNFVITAALAALVGFGLRSVRPTARNIYAREGFVIVGGGWLLMSLFGALPFVLCGDIPSYIDALFEITSGFTTTGASILTDVESLSRGCLFWRSFAHWVGGMGFLVFVMAVLPMSGEHSMHIMRAEVPGPVVGKLVPRARQTARILYLIYFVLTVVETILLMLGGLDLFDALIHAFGTAGTGGFSNKAISVAAFDSVYVEMVMAVFMVIFSINFNLYYLLLLGRLKDVLKNEELRCFLAIVVIATVSIALNISGMYGGIVQGLRHAFFNVTSIMSTSGFGTVDFTQWPVLSQTMLVLLMIVGAMAGSTGGGIKVSRLMIIFRGTAAGFMQMVDARTIKRVQLEGRRVNRETVRAVYLFCTLYAALAVLSTLLISFDGFDFYTNFTATLSCLSNVGPGMALVGPMGNYSIYSPLSTLLLALMMLLGRLEILPMLALFIPAFRKNK